MPPSTSRSESEVLEKDPIFIVHAMHEYIDQHLLIGWVVTVQCFLMEPIDIKIQVLA